MSNEKNRLLVKVNRKFGIVQYRDHIGDIQKDSHSIKDRQTKDSHLSTLHWVTYWDIKEGRDPPTMFCDAAVPSSFKQSDERPSTPRPSVKENVNDHGINPFKFPIFTSTSEPLLFQMDDVDQYIEEDWVTSPLANIPFKLFE